MATKTINAFSNKLLDRHNAQPWKLIKISISFQQQPLPDNSECKAGLTRRLPKVQSPWNYGRHPQNPLLYTETSATKPTIKWLTTNQPNLVRSPWLVLHGQKSLQKQLRPLRLLLNSAVYPFSSQDNRIEEQQGAKALSPVTSEKNGKMLMGVAIYTQRALQAPQINSKPQVTNVNSHWLDTPYG